MRNAILALFIVLVTLTTIGHAQTSIPNCGAFGVDLTPISFDISKNVSTSTDPGYIYVVHPCGAVTDAGCVADPTSTGSMVCQRGLSDAYSLSKWNSSTVVYSRDRFGLYQQLITGELCGSTPRQSLIYYQCSLSDTTPRIISIAEGPQCVYNIVIYTSLTCALPVEAPCVFAGVDFNDLFAQGDLNFTTAATGFNWYVHMCASSTSNARCRNDSTSNTSMICQQRVDLSDSFGIAIYNESTIQWQVVPTGNNAGMMFTVPNGEYCAAAGRNRIATIQMICDPTLGLESSYIYGIAEVQTCLYQITIRTPLSCSVLQLTSSSTGQGISLSSSWWPAQQTCTFNGYNLQAMANGPDLHWGGFVNNVYYDFYYHMCGWVRNLQCAGDSSTYNSMFCQTSITNAEDNFGLDYFVPGQWVGWTTTQYGISYSSYLGELCGTTRRLTTVNFVCDPQGTTRIDTILIDPISQCNINMTIKTPLVCNPNGSNAPPVIPECIFNGWDFRYLTPNNEDLQLYVNGSTSYYITLHMCGVVVYRPCKLDNTASNAMICQTQAQPGGDSYSLSTYVPASETWTEFPQQQMIQMRVATGELCGSTPRVANVNFICDLAFQSQTGLTTQLISYNETSSCVYQLVVIANPIVCPYFNGSGWNTTSSSTGSQTPIGNTGVGIGCTTGANLPVGSVAVSIVLDQAFAAMINSINYINTQLLGALANVLGIPVSQLQCGQLSGGILPAVAAPTTAQTLYTFYILPPAAGQIQTPAALALSLGNIINTNPAVINMVLPLGVPPIVQGQFASLTCPPGQYAGADGVCHSSDSGSSGLSGGAIAGIVVGSIVGAILLIGVVVFLLSRDGRKNKGFSSSEGGRGVEMQEHSEQETEEETY